jgi:hypothetical protein
MGIEGIEQYRVSLAPAEFEKLRRWGTWAAGVGVLDDFLVALKTINFRLAFEPLDWGEPRCTLEPLHLEVRFGTFKMLNVWYGANVQKRVVFVKVFEFRSDYPPGRPPEGK